MTEPASRPNVGARIAVADAGPLIHLDELDCLGLLTDFIEVRVPEAVWREVERHRPQALLAQDIPWIKCSAPTSRKVDAVAALYTLHPGEREALSLCIDYPESLLLTDDGLSFRRPGVGPDVTTRLRRGHWSIQAEIDLHGLRREEAREALLGFLSDASRRGQRCVRVVHGKGHGSPGRRPVLKAKAQRWLAQCADVIAFAQASGPQGGAGALIALLDRRAGAGG